MLKLALFFLVVSIIAAVFGFTGISAAAAGIAKVLFLIFIVAFVILLILGLVIGDLLGRVRITDGHHQSVPQIPRLPLRLENQQSQGHNRRYDRICTSRARSDWR